MVIRLEKLEGVQISIGELIEEEEFEPMGPHPFPSITTLRSWDHKLLRRYRPFYAPFCDVCCVCAYGRCDLVNKRGACGIDSATQQARFVLLACTMGFSAHLSHAKHLVGHLIQKLGPDHPIDLGSSIEIEAPLIRNICGIKPRKLGDLTRVLSYLEGELSHLLASTITGQECAALDFESKSLHAGMLDLVALEVADLAQICGFNFPKGDPKAPLADIGLGTIDISKPVVLAVGHNVVAATGICDYIEKRDLVNKIELGGICCTGHDLVRYRPYYKIVGHMTRAQYALRAGIANVVVLDEQCVRLDLLTHGLKLGVPIIAVSDKICAGLPDRTQDDFSNILEDIVSGSIPGAFISDPELAGKLAVEVALRKPKPQVIQYTPQQISQEAARCIACMQCRRNCPIDLDIPAAMKSRDISASLRELYEYCLGCGRCEQACPQQIPILDLLRSSALFERGKIRVGRGPILDTEIRNVGAPIVLGEIPGVIGFVGCGLNPHGRREVAEMADEFARRRYILVSSGCQAMDLGLVLDDQGRSIYERYPGDFDAGCIVNVGSCVANAHIAGAAIKIASIFARRNLRGNFEEIADYILNRVGAVGVAWGAMSQKAAAIATGFNRYGIPVILGPQGSKYRRAYLGRKDLEECWNVYDVFRKGELCYVGPAPEHLIYPAENYQEAMVMIPKLCIRPNDTTRGRQIKLTHYFDLHLKFMGRLPDDWALFVRTEADIPLAYRKQLIQELESMGWKPRSIPDPTLLERFRSGWRV